MKHTLISSTQIFHQEKFPDGFVATAIVLAAPWSQLLSTLESETGRRYAKVT